MGVPFFHHPVGQEVSMAQYGDGMTDPFPITHLRTGQMIYLLGRRAEEMLCPKCTHKHGVYFIQGAFTEPSLAEAAALDETYFVGPLPLNMALPHELIEWHGLYWPLQVRKDDTDPTTIITQPS